MLCWFLALAAAAASPAPEVAPPPPRLVLAGGLLFGPHAAGEATCQASGGVQRCEHTGNFFGVGANLELRVRAVGPLYFHGRGAVIGNVRRRPYGVHRGLADLGVGLGVYSRLAFIRVEYMFVPTFGPDTYRPPFYDKQAGRDVWKRSAGLVSGGVRKYFTARFGGELWGGLMIGPRSRRTTLQEDAGIDRVLITFLAGVNLVFDVIPGRAPPPKSPPPAPTTSPAATSPAPTTSPATTSPATTSPATTSPATTSPAPTTSPDTISPAPTTSPATTAPADSGDALGPWQPAPQ